MAKKITPAPVSAPAPRWRVASRSRRPIVHKADIQVCFVADSLDQDGETPRPDAPGPIVTLGFEHPELASTKPEAVLAELEKTLEWRLWIDSQADVDEIQQSLATLQESIDQLSQGEQTRESWHNRRELLIEVTYEKNRLSEAIGPAQDAYDAATAKSKALLNVAAQAAYEAILAQRRAILQELAAAADPLLDKLALNADALSRKDHGGLPNLGPRPELPPAMTPEQIAAKLGQNSSALVRA